jgi:nudix-type nucleoside diphosphatase (YffH/AdpP family)
MLTAKWLASAGNSCSCDWTSAVFAPSMAHRGLLFRFGMTPDIAESRCQKRQQKLAPICGLHRRTNHTPRLVFASARRLTGDAPSRSRSICQDVGMPPSIARSETLYEGWLRILGLHIRSEQGEEVRREVEDHGRAVAVLPYDPERRNALVIKLLRAPVLLAAGDPELLEAPAGMVDDGEDAAAAVIREAREETGVRLSALEHLGAAWSMPGISTERIDLYLAPYAQRDRIEAGGGVAGEHENITVVEMPLHELWSMVERGELTDMKTQALVLHLQARHPELFRRGAASGDEPPPAR